MKKPHTASVGTALVGQCTDCLKVVKVAASVMWLKGPDFLMNALILAVTE